MKTKFTNGKFKGQPFGKPAITHQTELLPPCDKLIAGIQNTLWDAWQIGLQPGGNTVYPRLPLLDREPMEPEM